MNKNMKFAIIGGDSRHLYLAKSLAQDGYNVNIFALDIDDSIDNIYQAKSLKSAIDDVDNVILPLPISLDNETVNASLTKETVELVDLFKLMNKNQILFAGKISDKVHSLMNVYSIYANDYLNREELAVLNAIPTAEGALEIAMAEMPITIHSSNCLVIGYGRIGKLLAKMLTSLGANVTVSARRFDDLAWIKAYGHNGIQTKDIGNYIEQFDIVFNTVPFLILTKEILEKFKQTSLIIDLASKPGGADV